MATIMQDTMFAAAARWFGKSSLAASVAMAAAVALLPLPVHGQDQKAVRLAPPEKLDGPPLVTCKAWAIADGRTGELLYGYNQDEKRENASTTKIMTAHLVLKLAAENPAVLDEVITFSERADKTGGSTSDVRAGESLTVGELLYGLMLPSGNDASVALAEHFGSRFPSVSGSGKAAATKAAAGGDDAAKANKNGKPAAGQNGKANESGDAAKADNAAEDAYNRFVAEMNREAARLGMKNSQYKNPHGLSAPGHGVSARDLLILAHAAMQDPLFRKYVSTREHKSKLTAADGSTREITWKNTNQLLGIAGYDGIKTGTTGPAGACLVSSGRLGDDHLLVAVLGSTSSDARYVDSRNLYRWAWKQRAEK